MKKGVLFFSLFMCVFFGVSTISSAQSKYIQGEEPFPKKLSISVLEIVEPETGETNRALKNIIQTSAEISLRERGLNTYMYKKRFDYSTVLSSQQQVHEFLNHIQDDFVLIITYSSIEKNRVRLNMYWLNKAKGEITIDKREELYLNFEFDRRVSSLTAKLLREANAEIRALKQEIQQEERQLPKPKVALSQKGKATGAMKTEETTPYPAYGGIPPSRSKFYLMSFGFSPFFPMGQAEGYFYLGMNPTLDISYQSKIPTGYLGLGFVIGVNYFFAVGFNAAADVYLTQIGTNISYVSNPLANLPIGLFIYTAEGAAILTVNLNRNQLQSTVLGFAKGGIGLSLFLTEESGLIIDVAYGISIGRNETIAGISPELFIYSKM